MLKLKFFFSLSIMLFLSIAESSTASLNAAIPAAIPPPMLIDDASKLEGLLPEYTLLISKFLGRKTNLVLLPRSRLRGNLKKGTVDFLCYTNPSWADDASEFEWSHPIFVKREVIIGPKTAPRDLKDVHGEILGTLLGYRYPLIDPYFQQGHFSREDAPNEEANLNKLMTNHIPFVLTDEMYFEAYKKTHPDIDRDRQSWPAGEFPISCSVSRNGQLQVKDLNRALAKLKASKKLEALFKKFGVSFHAAK